MQYYQRLKNLRIDNDLTQKQMGDIIGVSQRTISHYESGKREPGITEIKRYARYFNVSTDYIICITDNPKTNWENKTQKIDIKNNYGKINIK